jgi:hypothetical protein
MPRYTGKKTEGFWRQKEDRGWISDWVLENDPTNPECIEYKLPWPQKSDTPASPEFVDALAAVEAVANVDACMGMSRCRICRQGVGCREFDLDDWVWPEGFAHYVTAHNVHPTPEFETFVIERARDLKESRGAGS